MPEEKKMKNARFREYEAAEVGFDPRDMIEAWEEHALVSIELNDICRSEKLATHPTNASRIAKLKYYLPAAMELFKKAPSIDTTLQTINWQGVLRNILERWSRFRDYKNKRQSGPDRSELAALVRHIRDDIYPRLKTLEDVVLKYYGQIYILPSTDIEKDIAEATGDRETLADVLNVVYLRPLQVEQAMGFRCKRREWKDLLATEETCESINSSLRRLEEANRAEMAARRRERVKVLTTEILEIDVNVV
ncbi:hypothetical protein BKA61DRAFT_676590 [Leptodontidium sp. MPI-SDFR-AT-0119]|nr:hypothetical protein BKA61DRAFT_676590 [Leptodontidium sp. MPI-SDFR-AT-0119]